MPDLVKEVSDKLATIGTGIEKMTGAVKTMTDRLDAHEKRIDDLSSQMRARPMAGGVTIANGGVNQTVTTGGTVTSDIKAACKNFSFAKAIQKLTAGLRVDDSKGWDDAQTELQVLRFGSEERAKSSVLNNGPQLGFVIPAVLMPDLIPLNRTNYILDQLGIDMRDNLKGAPVTWNRQASATTFYWTGENPSSNFTESDPTLEQINLTPHEAVGVVRVSNRLFNQDPAMVESIIRNDLGQQALRAKQIAYFAGTGYTGQPLGLLNYGTTAVGTAQTPGTINTQALTSTYSAMYALLVKMIGGIAADNNDISQLKWVMHPNDWFSLMQATIGVSTSAPAGTIYPPVFAADPSKGLPATLCGYPVMLTGDMTEDTIMLANYSQSVIGTWGGFELASSDVAENAFLRNQQLIRLIFSMDCALYQPTAFCKGTGFSL